jgi:hypothetical protein
MILAGTDPRVRRKRTRKAVTKQPLDRTAVGSAACVLFMTVLYILFLCETERVLDSVETGQTFRFHNLLFQQPPSNSSALPDDLKDDKFILFDHNLGGQGAGNVISGLLAAHLLGQEFNRTVCLLPDYTAFSSAFDAVGERAVQKCPILWAHLPPPTKSRQIKLINYMVPPDECELQNILKSDDQVLYLTGNTYPRWPSVPDGFFFQHYKAKQVLLDILPYDYEKPPSTVVHLREPDSVTEDARSGLDKDSLKALGDMLPPGKETYLVTNRVAYYQQFEDCCQWSHPMWHTVIHSANGRQWGSLQNETAKDFTQIQQDEELMRQQNLQMWADWYTVLTADTVYHTHSDFSISAIHWMNNVNSHSIFGYNAETGVLETKAESWWVDGETAPLSQRSQAAVGTSQLRLCQGNHHMGGANHRVRRRVG